MERPTANRITAIILLAGLGVALAVFMAASPTAQPGWTPDPLSAKQYNLELEKYGGKANILATEISQTFQSLWHGRNLAYTIAVLTVAGAWLFWYVATTPPGPEADSE
ncbi:MAG TPA: hypothetical protein VHE61_16405 [Opitutaceae bacterium]|nr:hypothetical protein [Opitutaceae bacterium]